MSTERETLVLLDAHAIIHRAYHALPDFSSSTGEPTGALFGLCNMLFKILDELKPTYIVACYDLPQPTHRHDVYDKYKATRKKGDEALVQQLISSRDVFAAFGIPMYDCPGYEADDVLGTIVREVREMKHLRTIIASGDMDTMQLITDDSVLVYTLRKGIQDTVLYDQKAVEARFGFSPQAIPDYKGFAGDTSDNIPGIKGIGEKTATQLIQLFGGVDGVYKALAGDSQVLVKHGFKPKANQLITAGEEEAQFSKMLATIRTDAPIAFTMPAVYDIKDAAPHILSLCEHYEFRSLVQKVSRLAGVSLAPKLEQRVAVEESPERTQRALIALWLLQSDRTNPTIDDVLRFAKRETVAEAYSVLEQLIGERGLTFVFNDIEVPLAPVVQRMNAAGVLLDLELLKKLSVEYHTELSAIEASIYDLAGKTFNVNSPKQLGEVLYDDIGIKPVGRARTPTGARSTKEADLVKVLDAHPVVQKVLDYRELQKLLSTYIDTLPEMVDGEGRLHTTFQQMGTTTGRLSSVEPNLQNIPIKTAYGRRIREAFVPPAGKCLVALDYAQIELRIAAILSGEQTLVDAFSTGTDVHTAVASDVFGVPRSDVTPEMRRKAKVINFGILYGMGANALRQNLGESVSQKDARAYLDAYFQKYSRLSEWIDHTKAEAKRLGYTSTLFGRRRYFEGFNSSLPFIRAAAERMAVNAPIQGTQADIIKLAMIRAQEYIDAHPDDKAVLVLQVHDELVFEVAETRAEPFARSIKNIMESVLTETQMRGVPIVVAYAYGKRWGELK